MELAGRVVVITGGGSGIGESLARATADAGASHVVVADLNGNEAQRVAAEIGGTGVELDVRDEQAIVDLVEATQDAHGPIDVLCSNAGFAAGGGVEVANEVMQSMWEVHVMAHLYAARAVLPSMIARGEGYLLNTASAAGLLTQIGSVAYAVTKHAAVGLAEWLAVSHHHQGIRVSVLCPQAVQTNISANSPDPMLRRAAELRAASPTAVSAASVDGVLGADEVAEMCLEAMAEERFWVLPHTEVAEYVKRKADDVDRWLDGMRRFQAKLYGDAPLPGDAIYPGR